MLRRNEDSLPLHPFLRPFVTSVWFLMYFHFNCMALTVTVSVPITASHFHASQNRWSALYTLSLYAITDLSPCLPFICSLHYSRSSPISMIHFLRYYIGHFNRFLENFKLKESFKKVLLSRKVIFISNHLSLFPSSPHFRRPLCAGWQIHSICITVLSPFVFHASGLLAYQ